MQEIEFFLNALLWKNRKESNDKKEEKEYAFIKDNIGKMLSNSRVQIKS